MNNFLFNLIFGSVWGCMIIIFITINSIYIYNDPRSAKEITSDNNSNYNKNTNVISSVGVILGVLTNVVYFRYFGPYLTKSNCPRYYKLINVLLYAVCVMFLIFSLKVINGNNAFSKFQLSLSPINTTLILLNYQTLNSLLTNISPIDENFFCFKN